MSNLIFFVVCFPKKNFTFPCCVYVSSIDRTNELWLLLLLVVVLVLLLLLLKLSW